jgi:gamma-glutamylcyclotransferase (GGCT)/AIG2-like uncharacterized protein YtfP
MEKAIVAVYGSLKQGFGNHLYLQDAKYLSDAKIVGWDMYSFGPFPMVVPGDGTVAVELYEVDKHTMQGLDGLEGFPRFYNRMIVETQAPWCPVEAWLYFGSADQVEQMPRVSSGVWTHSERTDTYE